MEQHHEKLLWKIDEVAHQLNVSPRTVLRLINRGDLAQVQIGRAVRIPKQTVLDWVERRTRYNLGCVESVPSSKGESTCDSINVAASTTLPTNREVENRLDALLKLVKRE